MEPFAFEPSQALRWLRFRNGGAHRRTALIIAQPLMHHRTAGHFFKKFLLPLFLEGEARRDPGSSSRKLLQTFKITPLLSFQCGISSFCCFGENSGVCPMNDCMSAVMREQ